MFKVMYDNKLEKLDDQIRDSTSDKVDRQELQGIVGLNVEETNSLKVELDLMNDKI